MKAAGALAVVFSCTFFGFSMARSLNERTVFLRALVRALTLLRNELCASLLPVKEVLAVLAEDEHSPVCKFFADCLCRCEDESFRSAWMSASLKCREWGLDNEECRQLASLGGIIGRYEAAKQQEFLEQTIAYFGRRTKLAEDERQQKCKLRTALGAGTGMLLAILML